SPGIWITLVAPSDAYRFRSVRIEPQGGPYPPGVTSFPFGRLFFDLEVPTAGETCEILLFYGDDPFPEFIDSLYYWDGTEWVAAVSIAELDSNIRRFRLTYEDGGPADLAN